MDTSKKGEEVEENVKSISCENEREEEDDVEWVIDENLDESIKLSQMVAAKIWTNRRINETAMIKTLRNVWNPKYGHGDKECDMFRSDLSPKKNFGLWLKASPWKKAIKERKEEDKGQQQKGARRRFFPKLGRAERVVEDEEIRQVVNQMHDVSFTLSGEDTREEGEKSMMENETIGKEDNVGDQNQITNNQSDRGGGESLIPLSKKWKRMARENKNSSGELLTPAGSKGVYT